MRFVIIGAPGAGKGTQAVLLAEKLNLPHISTGDIFRLNIKNGTKLGKKASEYIEKGLLVPDDITVDILSKRLEDPDCKNGFILDGFPRTIDQAEYLDNQLKGMGISLDFALYIDVSDENIIKRMSGRRVCESCGKVYHVIYSPTKVEGVCDDCESRLIQREDDSQEIVMSRLRTFHDLTEKLLDYYRMTGRLIVVKGREVIEMTSKEVLKALEVYNG